MNKGKVVRLAGFVGALGLSTVLVTTAIQGTGAYFTSSVNGQLTATTGHLEVKSSTDSLNFGDLNPGSDQTLDLTYRISNDSTTNADVWLVFNPNSAAFGAFTGAKDSSGAYDEYLNGNGVWYTGTAITDGGLGQYGHFKVSNASGKSLFESYNLAYEAAGSEMDARNNAAQGCIVDADGRGGSDDKHALGEDNGGVNWCGVPAAILLQKNLSPSSDLSSSKITFGVTGKMSAQDSAQVNVPFQIVATQPGEYPLVQKGTTDPDKVGVGHVGTNW